MLFLFCYTNVGIIFDTYKYSPDYFHEFFQKEFRLAAVRSFQRHAHQHAVHSVYVGEAHDERLVFGVGVQ